MKRICDSQWKIDEKQRLEWGRSFCCFYIVGYRQVLFHANLLLERPLLLEKEPSSASHCVKDEEMHLEVKCRKKSNLLGIEYGLEKNNCIGEEYVKLRR